MYENLMRKLAEFEPTKMPVLSIYLDLRPQETGENPGVRSGETVLKDRLNEVEKSLGVRGEEVNSFRVDKEKIEKFINSEVSKETQGAAIFACSAKNLWETVEIGKHFENEVLVGEIPDLFQLAELLDKHEKAVVALIDSSTARFFVTDYGVLEEVEGENDRNSKMYRKTALGGWKQKKYQRNIENNRENFAKSAAKSLEEIIEKEDVKKLIIAGDEASVPYFQNALTPKTREILHDNVLQIDIRATKDEVAEEAWEIIEEFENTKSHAGADRVIGEFKRDGLGVMGVKATKFALENGQVDTLLMDASAEGLTEEVRNEFIRLASTTNADVELVENHEKFASLDGVGALLRYKL